MAVVDDVERVVAPVVASLRLELVDVEVHPGTVRITLDRDVTANGDGTPDLDEIGAATAAISRALDQADPVPGGRYELEVSSPGVERRLRKPEHFARFVGTDVAVRTKPGVDGDRRFTGRLEAADDDGIVVAGSGSPGTSRRLAYRDLDRVHTIFDWKAALAGTSAQSGRAERRQGRHRSGAGHEATKPAHHEAVRTTPDTTETR